MRQKQSPVATVVHFTDSRTRAEGGAGSHALKPAADMLYGRWAANALKIHKYSK